MSLVIKRKKEITKYMDKDTSTFDKIKHYFKYEDIIVKVILPRQKKSAQKQKIYLSLKDISKVLGIQYNPPKKQRKGYFNPTLTGVNYSTGESYQYNQYFFSVDKLFELLNIIPSSPAKTRFFIWFSANYKDLPLTEFN